MYICCNNNNFTGDFRTFAWPNIRYLYPFNNINFTGIFQLYDWPRLIWLACFNNNFTHLSGSLKTQIKMITCNFSGNAITESAEIDLALSDLEVNAADVGRTVVCNVNFSGGTNSGPTAAGTASKDNLVNNHGWTVTLNPEV